MEDGAGDGLTANINSIVKTSVFLYNWNIAGEIYIISFVIDFKELR